MLHNFLPSSTPTTGFQHSRLFRARFYSTLSHGQKGLGSRLNPDSTIAGLLPAFFAFCSGTGKVQVGYLQLPLIFTGQNLKIRICACARLASHTFLIARVWEVELGSNSSSSAGLWWICPWWVSPNTLAGSPLLKYKYSQPSACTVAFLAASLCVTQNWCSSDDQYK